MKIYVIDNEIVFFPEKRRLLSLKNSSSFSMHGTSARCLDLLLERQGKIVTQSELMIAGWGEDAIRTISHAAYYQCFVSLRRAFKELGYNKQLFATVRGQGIRFNSYIEITVKEESSLQEDVVTTGSEDETSDLQKEAAKKPDAAILNAEHIASPVPPMLQTSEQNNKNKSPASHRLKYILLIIGAGIFVGFIFHYYFYNQPAFHINGFARQSDAPSCFYFNERNSDNNFASHFMSERGYICDNHKQYFISYFSISPRLTIFACDKRASFSCDSETYILNKKHE